MKNRYSKTVFEEVRRQISRDLKGKTQPDLYLIFAHNIISVIRHEEINQRSSESFSQFAQNGV